MSIDLRRIRVGIEVGGAVQWYEDPAMRVRAVGTKSTDPTQNDCTVIITNLNRATRQQILSEASPFDFDRVPKRVIVEVGRIFSGVFTLFVGDIISVEPGGPPDIDLTIKAKTGWHDSGKIVARSGLKLELLSRIAQGIATDLEIMLAFEATDKQIGSFSHTGAAADLVKKLALTGDVDAFIDDRTLIVKDLLQPRRGAVRVLNARSGMVGLPSATERGLKVTYLIDGESRIGGALRIQSEMNPAMDGDYTIGQLMFEATSHSSAFFYTAQCWRAA